MHGRPLWVNRNRGRASSKSGYVRCAPKAENQTIGIGRNGPLRVDDVAPPVIQAPKLEPRIMRYELSDYEWTTIKPMLPNKPRGVRRVDDRRVLNGIFWSCVLVCHGDR